MPDIPLASLAPPNPLATQVAGFPAQARGMLANMFGITDAMRALRGEMTPEEAQNFALTGAVGLIPGAGEAAPLARLAEKMAPEAAEAAIPLASKAIRAYHGSPYDFDKFSLDKIGTGEGAQAYGHGLYFAEHPQVAQRYKERLFGRGMDLPSYRASQELENAGGNVDEALASLQSYHDRLIGHGPVWKEVGEAIDLLKAGNLPPRGRIYEVNINADPEHFLDWDKPLSEQSPQVQKAMQPYIKAQLDKVDQLPWSGQEKNDLRERLQNGNISGAEIYRAQFGHEDAQALRQAGIPGIKYLDQGSRSAGQGTSNYVVFDPSIIDIIKKYGLAGLIAGGAAHYSLPTNNQSQVPLSSLQQ